DIAGVKADRTLRRPGRPGGHQEPLVLRFGKRAEAVVMGLPAHDDGVAGRQEGVEAEAVRRVGQAVSLAPIQAKPPSSSQMKPSRLTARFKMMSRAIRVLLSIKLGERSYHSVRLSGKPMGAGKKYRGRRQLP